MLLSNKLAVLGDSISEDTRVYQETGTTKRHRGLGYLNHACAYDNQRMQFDRLVDIFGVSGDNTREIYGRVGEVGKSRAKNVVLLGGANDIGGGLDTSETIENLAKIARYLIEVLDRKVILCEVLPQGSLSEADQAKIVAINTQLALLASSNKDIVLATPYDDMADVNDDPVTNMLADTKHPTEYGASFVGKAIAAAIAEIYGPAPTPDWVTGNLLPNGTFAGTGGSKSGGALGTVANSCTLVGDVGMTCTGTANEPGQTIALSAPALTATGDTSGQFYSTITSGFSAGDVLEVLTDITIDSGEFVRWDMQFYNSAGGTANYVEAYTRGSNQYTEAIDRCITRSPPFIVPTSSTNLRFRVFQYIDASGASPDPRTAQMTIHNATVRPYSVYV